MSIEIEESGAPGTAKLKWKIGTTKTTGVTTLASPATVDLTSANIKLTFSGDLVEGDKFTFEICNEVCVSDPTPLVSWDPPVPAPANYHYSLVLTGPDGGETVFLRGQNETSHDASVVGGGWPGASARGGGCGDGELSDRLDSNKEERAPCLLALPAKK